MRKLTHKQLLSILVLLVSAFAAVTIGVRQAASAQPLPPMLSVQEMAIFEISQAIDVTSNPAALRIVPPLPASQAVDIASHHLGRASTNVRVLHAMAKPIHGLPARSVWIVMFSGGTLPVLGPAGNTLAPRPLRFAAVEIDDKTGEVLTWFMN